MGYPTNCEAIAGALRSDEEVHSVLTEGKGLWLRKKLVTDDCQGDDAELSAEECYCSEVGEEAPCDEREGLVEDQSPGGVQVGGVRGQPPATWPAVPTAPLPP